jgi:AcrR family transcriptional regulator
MSGAEKLDGRRRRSVRSRERIIESVIQALREADFEASGEQIATRAGVSISTLFRRFGDLENLAAAVRERVAAMIQPFVDAGPFSGSLDERVRELVRRRTALFETLAPFQRHALREPLNTRGARATQDRLETLLLVQLRDALGPELAAPGGADVEALLRVVLGFPAWDHLRRIQRLDPEGVSQLLAEGTLRLVDGLARKP